MSSQREGRRPEERHGGTNPVAVLLAGILVALVVLIVVLVTQRGGGDSGPSGPAREHSEPIIADGQTVRRSDLSHPPPSPKPVGDPDRIKETLRPEKTYHVVLKAGFDARVEDKAWWRKEVVSLAYAAEMVIDRTIEVNDGRRIVELRHFVASRNVKLLCNVEDVSIDLGTPGVLLLGALEYLQPGATAMVATAKPIAETLLGYGAEAVARSEATKAVAHVDTLSGKKVRIVYVDDIGVESIVPVGCTFTAEERDFVFGTAILSDCHILPDVKIGPGTTWTVDGSELAGLLDPSLRGRSSGQVVLAREADIREGDSPHATLLIREGTVTVDSSDASTRRIGSFTPVGSLKYDLDKGFVDRAILTGRFTVEEVSTDHILFETRFKSTPTLKIDYACAIR